MLFNINHARKEKAKFLRFKQINSMDPFETINIFEMPAFLSVCHVIRPLN